MSSDIHAFLCIPNSDNIKPCAAQSITFCTRKHAIHIDWMGFGDLCHNFNMDFCRALGLRPKINHFAMHHADIRCCPGWLDVLVEEMDRTGADIMTSVVAIKDERGLTTTGIRYPGQVGARRFTMAELHDLPETFSIADTNEPDQILAINTGCWIARFPASGWPDRFPGFEIKHRIDWRAGVPVCSFDSEDWLFGEWAHQQGLKVFATRKTEAKHQGTFFYGVDTVWGSCATDPVAPTRPLSEALRGRPRPNLTIETNKPVAVDSLDHISPLGAANDNSVNPAFNRKIYEVSPWSQREIRLLDLGCSGGGLVRSILDDGAFAVGIEGSDYSWKAERAEWPAIPDYLFTADITEPFTIKNCDVSSVKFNVVTAWEVLEHIEEEKIPAVVANIRRHLVRGGLVIGSINERPEPHHRTCKPREWWVKRLGELGLSHAPSIEEALGDDVVRGPANTAGSFVVAFRDV